MSVGREKKKREKAMKKLTSKEGAGTLVPSKIPEQKPEPTLVVGNKVIPGENAKFKTEELKNSAVPPQRPVPASLETTEEKAERIAEEKEEKEERKLKELKVTMDARHITITLGTAHRIYIPTDRLPDLIQELAKARDNEIARLKGEITKLQSLDRDTSTAPGTLFDDMTPTTIESKIEKAPKSGYCMSCDEPLEAGSGQPCAVCKNFSHKTCLDANVCAYCLDKA